MIIWIICESCSSLHQSFIYHTTLLHGGWGSSEIPHLLTICLCSRLHCTGGLDIIYSILPLQFTPSTSLLWCSFRKKGKDGHLRAKGKAKCSPALTFALAIFHATIYMKNATGWVHSLSLVWNCRNNLDQLSWLKWLKLKSLLPT